MHAQKRKKETVHYSRLMAIESIHKFDHKIAYKTINGDTTTKLVRLKRTNRSTDEKILCNIFSR